MEHHEAETPGDKWRTILITTPDNKKQKIRATDKTCGMQILKTVCDQHGLEVNKWGLKHCSRLLDVANPIQFLALPENATLELVELTPERQENPVSISLHLEDGRRLRSVFQPGDNVWTVLSAWAGSIGQINPELLQPASYSSVTANEEATIYPVCIYLRRTIVGEEELKQITLRELGLIGGSACIRFVRRTRTQLARQECCTIPYNAPVQMDLSQSQSQSDQDSQVSWSTSPGPGEAAGHDQMEAEMNGIYEMLNGFHLDDDDIFQSFIEGKPFKRAWLNLKISDNDTGGTPSPEHSQEYLAKKSKPADNS